MRKLLSNTLVQVLLGTALVIAVTILLNGQFEDKRTPEELIAEDIKDTCKDGSISARFMAEDVVRARLRAPSTASFLNPQVSHLGDCKHLVLGYVDAQNGFGAMIRSEYAVELFYEAEERNWRATAVSVQ